MFELDKYIEGDIAIIKISGNMLDTAAMALREDVRQLNEQNIRNVILEMSNVRLLNSCFGLGVLMACWGCLNRSGGQFKIAGPNPKISHILAITKLDQVLDIYDTVDAAKMTFPAEYHS